MYSTDQIFQYILENNLQAIYARLVQEGRVSATSTPSAEVLSFILEQQSQMLPLADYYDWLQNLLDVPADTQRPYFQELQSIRQSTGNSPAKYLVDQFRQGTSETLLTASPNAFHGFSPIWVSSVIWILALIGLFVVGRLLGKLVQKALD